MAGITGLGTTYNLPNYTGMLFALTPSETPFLSAIGGLTGGGQSISTEFEWEFFDLRTAAQSTAVEGAAAPTAQARVRSNATNVVQIHQEKVSVSYSKVAAVGQKAGSNNTAPNPVQNEVDWQVMQMLIQMVRDVEYSFVNGLYQKPTDNSTPRKTRGLLPAIQTNKINAGTVVKTGAATAAAGSTITATAHGLNNGDQVYLVNQATTTTLPERNYFVVNTAANTFQVALVAGGTAITVDADGTVDAYKAAVLALPAFGGLLQSIFDNGGLTNQSTATIIVNSDQKRAISTMYANAYGKYMETNRNVGGVNVTTVETDFGILNVMLDRMVPKGKLIVSSLDQCTPVFLEVPGKGHFFAEPLAKTGSSDDVQLYGEVGLAYGNERAHGVLTGLAV